MNTREKNRGGYLEQTIRKSLFLFCALLIIGTTLILVFSLGLTFISFPEKLYGGAKVLTLAMAGFLSSKIYFKMHNSTRVQLIIVSLVFSVFLFLVSLTAYGRAPTYMSIILNFLIILFSLFVGSNTKKKKTKRRKRKKH